MKKKLLISIIGVIALLTIFSVVVMAAVSVSLDSVDFGDAGTEEVRHNLVGWGRSITDEIGGNYGGIGPDGCRLVWDGVSDGPDAEFTLSTSGGHAETLIIRHLDGLTDDSFDIHVKGATDNWIPVGSYSDYYTRPETWVTTAFFLNTLGSENEDIEFKITATGLKWSGFPTWGQLCIDWADLDGSEQLPEPGAFCKYNFKPPVSLGTHELNVRAKLPIKFWLADCEGDPLRGDMSPTLVVHYLGDDQGQGAEEYPPLSLKIGTGGYQYLAHFRPEMAGKHKVVITYDNKSWQQTFVVVENGNGNDKSQSEEKLAGKDKVKPGKPESEPQGAKPRGKPGGTPPGKGKGPKKP